MKRTQDATIRTASVDNILGRLGEVAGQGGTKKATNALGKTTTGKKMKAAGAKATKTLGKKIATSPAAKKIANSLSRFGSRSQLANMQHTVDAMLAYAMGIVSGLQVCIVEFR